MNRLIFLSLRQPWLMLLLLLAMFAAGIFAFHEINIEAYPDPVPPMVEVIAQNSGQSAEEIERYVTIPIEIQMAGIPHITAIRSISLFGLSDIKIQFTYDFTYEEAEQRVINQLTQVSGLPAGVSPQISPESPIGEIYRYQVKGPPGYSSLDLKTIQDWILQRRFKAVPGVIDVTGWGGKTKAYEVAVDQNRLLAHGVTLQQILTVLNNSNINVGAQTINFGEQAAIVRGIGLIQDMDALADTMVSANNGAPVLLRDVATITVSNLPRLGIAGRDNDDDIVQGIVLMRRGARSTPTILGVEQEVARITHDNILPPGVSIEPIYDRSQLIALTTRTVLDNMLIGITLIFLIQWIFLGNLKTACITSATIPFALCFAIALMVLRGESANLLSVGAIDFGLIVDATVIMVENIFRRLAQPRDQRFVNAPQASQSLAPTGFRGTYNVIALAAVEVSRGIFFSAAIIIAAFVPLFTLSGVEGHIFGPMARTYAYALAGGLIATFTIAPALSALLLRGPVVEADTPVVRWLHRLYEPIFRAALRQRLIVGCFAILLGVAAILAVRGLGLEFLPKLEEGNFWIRATMPTSVSLEAGNATVDGIRAIVGSHPEVITVVSQHGRPDDGTDATGFFNAEFFVPLKPFGQWPAGLTKEKLTAQLQAEFEDRFPGVDFNFSQNIEDNVEEAASGVKGENSVKLFGDDLPTLEATASRIAAIMGEVPGITDLAVLRSLGQPTVRIDIDRLRAARYGLQPGDINATIAAAIGGTQAGSLYERGADRNFPIIVRLRPQDRNSLDAIRRIPIGVATASGGTMMVPLADVATVGLASGASFIYREGQKRYLPIKFSVRGRDLGTTVLDAQRAVARKLVLPGGYRLEWVGEFGNLEDAISRLSIIVPLSFGLICLLLFANFSSVIDMLLAASVIPMAMVGGIFSLFITGTAFSVSAAIGFVALFGIAAMDGIIVITYYNTMIESGLARADAIIRTCHTQMRPVLMTCIVACVGLLPAALSNGIGSQVQKPLALVVVGGILLAPILILIVLPVLIDSFSRRGLPPPAPVPTEPEP